jgi:hypothetical protein
MLDWKYAVLLQNSKEVMKKSDKRLLQRMPCFMTVLLYMLRKAITASRDNQQPYNPDLTSSDYFML